jgi:hypothetical protein
MVSMERRAGTNGILPIMSAPDPPPGSSAAKRIAIQLAERQKEQELYDSVKEIMDATAYPLDWDETSAFIAAVRAVIKATK